MNWVIFEKNDFSSLWINDRYYPGYSPKHKFTIKHFCDEFSAHMDDLVAKPGELILLGDYNIHVEKASLPGYKSVQDFIDILDSYDLKQLINFPTHTNDGTLDLVITSNPNSLCNIECFPGVLNSDHFPISFDISGLLAYNTDKVTVTIVQHSIF